MARNTSSTPGADGNDTIGGTSANDSLTGGHGNDVISGGLSDDVLQGDQAVPGTWFFETFDYDFSSSAGQAFDIETGTQTGSGYVSDFDESTLTNTLRDTTGNPEDFGVIYTSTLNVSAGGTYTFSTTSDDGSVIQIFDTSGTALEFDNQTGGTLDYMNNDFHQSSTTRSGTVELDPNSTYTIQIRYWENRGGDELQATVNGPDTGGSTESLATTSMLGDPPPPDFSTTGSPLGAPDNDTLIGGAGNDTLLGQEGDDVLYGDDGGASAGTAAWSYAYYDLPGGSYGDLASTGFTLNGGRDNTNTPTTTGQTNSLDPSDYDTGDRFALKFTSELTVTTGGTYTFSTSSDDGSRLFVDGVEVVANDGLHSVNTETGTITLAPGSYTIEIVYFENGGLQTLSGTLSGPDTGGTAEDLAVYDGLTPVGVDGNDVLDGGTGDDALFGEEGDDSLDGGADNDTLTGGAGDDTLTGGDGDDVFVYTAGSGADTITDFGTGNSGGIADGDPTNNDFVDLGGFYNDSTRAAVNLAGESFANNLDMLHADAADGRIDGVIDGTDYGAEIGDIDLVIEDGGGSPAPTSALTTDTTAVTCFCSKTRVATPDGPVEVGTLQPGDLVITADRGPQPLKLVLTSTLSAQDLDRAETLRPVLIPAGALGGGLPLRDLRVSRQHRMLVRSRVARRMFDVDEVLVAAIKLVGVSGICLDPTPQPMTYVHLVFERHEVVFAEAAPSESFYPGREALKALPEAARQEFETLFPGLVLAAFGGGFARYVPAGKRQKNLVARIAKNRKWLLDDAA